MLRTRHILPLVAAATTMLASGAAVASAAKVAVATHLLVYTGVGTEANDLRIARHGGAFVVRDLTATLIPGAGCTRVTRTGRRAPPLGSDRSARISDGAPTGRRRQPAAPAGHRRSWRTGADTLESVLAHVTLYGGPGSDRLIEARART